MGERATLRLDSGDALRVVVERKDLDRREITVRRLDVVAPARGDLLRVIDEHLATAAPHPAGTTDRRLAAERDRQY